MKVLVGDPDPQLVAVLRAVLQREGYTVRVAHDGPEVLAVWQAEQPDLVLLEDQRLPRLAGWQVAQRLRRQARTPLILLSERPSEAAIIRGLESGADDYLVKPVSLRQLLARMQALLRRAPPTHAVAAAPLRAGRWVLDPSACTVTLPTGQPVVLTRLECRLLQVLLANAGRVVPYAQLVQACWGYADQPTSQLLKTHISRLRRKLGPAAQGAATIQAVLGVGYRLLLSQAEPPQVP